MKTIGYLISAVSVAILAFAALLQGDGQIQLLFVGVIFSLVGMFLRWLSHRKTENGRNRNS
jgi:predicted membrane protein